MENWRHYLNEDDTTVLSEIDANSPITYELLNSLLKVIIGAKQGLTGDALATASGIKDTVDSVGVVKDIFGFIGDFLSEKKLLKEEPITIGAVLVGLKVGFAGYAGAKKMAGLGSKLFKRWRNEPTEKTGKVPFLDLFNLDPKYAAIIDDRIEEEFLQWWLEQLEGKTGEVDTADLDVNARLIEFINGKYERELKGHTAPGTIGGTAGDIQKARKKVRGMQATGITGKHT